MPASSALVHDGVADVRGVYDPRWVGHRTLVASASDLLPFWSRLPAAMTKPADAVPIGFAATGFARPSYGLGVMMDPRHPLGLLVGHGGGGPGYAAAVFAVPAAEAVAIVLAADERVPRPRRPRSSCSRPPSVAAARLPLDTNPFNPVQRGRKGVG